jgi:mono/diheme cytochrome c family protein
MVVLVAGSLTACASTAPNQREISSRPGAQLYQQLCSSCHGVAGEGNGPVAPLVKIGVPDLTRIALRNRGEFPAGNVRRTIDGRFDRPAHGARDMPVWGWRFYNSADPNDAQERARVDAMIDQLVAYLRSIQKEKS